LSDLLAAYGRDDRVDTLFTLVDIPSVQMARVVRVDRGSCLVVTDAGLTRADPHAVASRRAGLEVEPTTGDWVALAGEPGSGLAIVAVLPRRSFIARKAPEDRPHEQQAIAANVDVVAITAALDRAVGASRIERSLALVWESGATPVVVLTKADVAPDIDAAVASAEASALAVPVLVTSAETGEGAEALADLVRPSGTLAFLGPSGSGKSSLVNRLVGEEIQRTGAVRGLDNRGRHTTTSRELVPLPGGGVLLDTPGLRSLSLSDVSAGMTAAFADIEALAAGCRFGDCAHRAEPGCAVQSAIAVGMLEPRRLDSYRKLERELERLERSDPSPQGSAARREYRQYVKTLYRGANPARFDERRQRHR
jgi:ribosome biogenesis GTPase